MTLNSPQKLVLLSVMAAGSIGFLGFSIAGLGKEVVTRMSAPPRDPANDKVSPELPLELLGDPFSHPVLAKAAEEADASSAGPAGDSMPPSLPGGLSGLTGLAPFNVGLDPKNPNVGEPAENAGLNRNID